jgi:hypothetical protein
MKELKKRSETLRFIATSISGRWTKSTNPSIPKKALVGCQSSQLRQVAGARIFRTYQLITFLAAALLQSFLRADSFGILGLI